LNGGVLEDVAGASILAIQLSVLAIHPPVQPLKQPPVQPLNQSASS